MTEPEVPTPEDYRAYAASQQPGELFANVLREAFDSAAQRRASLDRLFSAPAEQPAPSGQPEPDAVLTTRRNLAAELFGATTEGDQS